MVGELRYFGPSRLPSLSGAIRADESDHIAVRVTHGDDQAIAEPVDQEAVAGPCGHARRLNVLIRVSEAAEMVGQCGPLLGRVPELVGVGRGAEPPIGEVGRHPRLRVGDVGRSCGCPL